MKKAQPAQRQGKLWAAMTVCLQVSSPALCRTLEQTTCRKTVLSLRQDVQGDPLSGSALQVWASTAQREKHLRFEKVKRSRIAQLGFLVQILPYLILRTGFNHLKS